MNMHRVDNLITKLVAFSGRLVKEKAERMNIPPIIDEQTGVTELKPFGNRVTFITLLVICAIGLFGGLNILRGQIIWGFFPSSIAVVLLAICYVDLPKEPKTGAVLYCWGQPIIVDEKPIIVGGTTLLANFFPFCISGVNVDFTRKEVATKVKVTSQDKVVLEGTIWMVLYPDSDDILRFIEAGGKLDDIHKQLMPVIESRAREIALTIPSLEISNQGMKIADHIKEQLRDHLDKTAIAVRIINFRATFEQPKKVIEAMEKANIELSERSSDLLDYETNLMAAKKRQAEYENDPHRGNNPVPSLQECRDEVLEERLILENKVQSIKGARPAVVVTK